SEPTTLATTNQRQTQAIVRDGSAKRILLGLVRNLWRPQRILGPRAPRRRTEATNRGYMATILPSTAWVCRGLYPHNYSSQGVRGLRSRRELQRPHDGVQ